MILARFFRLSTVVLSGLGALGYALEVQAQTQTSTLGVTANVVNDCSIAGGTIDFGTYTSGQDLTVPAEGTIAYSDCPAGAVNVALDGGQAASEVPRSMTDGNGNSLDYFIFQDAARTQYWGTGETAQSLTVDPSGTGSWIVYGRIIRDQIVPAGTYSDSVNITLTF